MANFFYAVAIFADGHKETFEGRLWLLGGIKDEEGHAILQTLNDKKGTGEIISLMVDYES